MLDNSQLVLPFVPKTDDGDTFIYTEMLDRGQRKGNNGRRLLKTFYHRSQEEFLEQLPTIKHLCDLGQVRACTRLAPRSWKKVGKEFVRLVVETGLTENWVGMKTLYNRACGIASPISKRWLWDVDVVSPATMALENRLRECAAWIATIPSKKGLHYITVPFDIRQLGLVMVASGHVMENVQLHKDNPTNLYIPDGAD